MSYWHLKASVLLVRQVAVRCSKQQQQLRAELPADVLLLHFIVGAVCRDGERRYTSYTEIKASGEEPGGCGRVRQAYESTCRSTATASAAGRML